MAFKNLGIILLCGNCGCELSMDTPKLSPNISATLSVYVAPCKACYKKTNDLKKSLEMFLNHPTERKAE